MLSPIPAPEPLEPALHLGDYELLGEIGRGAVGVVYRARHRTLGRIVALKTLQPSLAHERGALERLRLESQAISRLEHSHIVPLYDVGMAEGRPFLTLRLFEKGSLADALRRRTYPPGEAARLVATVARAVHVAHTRGVIHRDLKPSNILLDEHDQPQVADFGLAKIAGEDTDLTVSTSVLGTPAYMAPEQAAGRTKDAGTPADIYSLGAILFHLLAGRPPFLGATAFEVFRQVMELEAPRVSRLNPAVDRDLEAVCLRALEKDPQRRYSSAAALADDLDRWQHGEPLSVRPRTIPEQLFRWVHRRPLVSSLTGFLLLAIVVGVLATAWQSREARRARADAALQSYVASLSIADRHLDSGESSKARTLLLQQPESLRGWEWRRLMDRAEPPLFSVPLWEEPASHHQIMPTVLTRVSSDLRHVATTHDGTLHLLEVATSRTLLTFGSASERIVDATFTPNGAALLTAGPGPGFHRWQLGVVTNGLSFGAEEDQPLGLAVSADGGRVVTWGRRLGRRVWHLPFDGAPTSRVELAALPGAQPQLRLRFSDDGSRILAADTLPDGQRAPVWDSATGNLLGLYPADTRGLRSVTWASDGRNLATVTAAGMQWWKVDRTEPELSLPPDPPILGEGGIRAALLSLRHRRLATVSGTMLRFWDLETGQVLAENPGQIIEWNQTSEDLLLTQSGDGTILVWDWQSGTLRDLLPLDYIGPAWGMVTDPAGRLAAAVVPNIGQKLTARGWTLRNNDYRLAVSPPLFRAAMSPDGSRIAGTTVPGAIWIHEVTDGRQLRRLDGHQRWVLDVHWTADGRWILSAGADHTVRRWDPDTGQCVATYTSTPRPMLQVVATTTGSRIAAADFSGKVTVWDGETRQVVHQIITGVEAAWDLEISPDDRWLAIGHRKVSGGVWDLTTGQQVLVFSTNPVPGRLPVTLAFSPDSTELTALSTVGLLYRWNLPDWKPTLSGRLDAGMAELLYTPDGARLIGTSIQQPSGGSGMASVDVLDRATGRRLARLGSTFGWSPSLGVSADGTRLFRTLSEPARRPRTLEVWNAVALPDLEGRSPLEQDSMLDTAFRTRALKRLHAPVLAEADEPPAWIEPRSNWPPRASGAPPGCLDLTPVFNGHLHLCSFSNDNWGFEDWTLGALPKGIVKLGGITWDLRGIVTTGVREASLYRDWRSGRVIAGIPAHQTARRLHFLHAGWRRTIDPEWGWYQVNYTDGTTAKLAIRQDVESAPWEERAAQPPTGASVAWEGPPFGGVLGNLDRPRLFHCAYDNPHPEKRIATLDLVAAGELALPFVVGITLEPADDAP